jgi:hypothetical protein
MRNGQLACNTCLCLIGSLSSTKIPTADECACKCHEAARLWAKMWGIDDDDSDVAEGLTSSD